LSWSGLTHNTVHASLSVVDAIGRILRRREIAETTLRSVLESTTDAYVGFDPQWRLEYANAQAAAIFASLGLAADTLPGRTAHLTFSFVCPEIVRSQLLVTVFVGAASERFYGPVG